MQRRAGARPRSRSTMSPISFRMAGDHVYTAVETRLAFGRRRRIRLHRGPDRLRKIDPSECRRRLACAVIGQGFDFRPPAVRAQRQAGYLFQAEALFPWKTAIDNVAIGLETAGVPSSPAHERAQDWLERVGLSSFGARYPHMLSGGQRKRVGLAQVLIRDPKILLMDEPFGPLDAQTRQIMGNLLLDLWSADRKAVLFVTHDLEEAIALSDRVVIMSAGPAARIIGDWKVNLPRPRDIAEVKLDPAFHALHREIWQKLKDEVIKGYVQTGGG